MMQRWMGALRRERSEIPESPPSNAAPPWEALTARVAALEAQLQLAEAHQTSAFWHALDRVYDAQLETRIVACIVCSHRGGRKDFGLRESRCIFGGGKLERYECPQCDCIFGCQKVLDLTDELLALEYRLLYSRYKEGDSTANEVRTFHSLRPRKDRVYANWGAGAWNGTIGRIRSEGFDLWGYEPSAPASAAHVVSDKSQLPQPLAGLMSNNVIEHFLDPVAQFREFHALLMPGGLMAHSSPCYDYRYEFSRFHTLFLLGRSPEILATRTGFRVVDRHSDGEYMNCVFERLPS
jgi:hypothetical protein